MGIWIKNSEGEPSASLTMSTVAFVVVTLWLLTWLIATPFGAPVPAFDAATAMAYLTPILALYFGRRWSINNGKLTAEGSGERDSAKTDGKSGSDASDGAA